MKYQTLETTIPISVIILKNNGTPETGRNALLYLYNDNTGSIILNGASMLEVQSGYYRYNWVHGLLVNTTITYYVLDAGSLKASGKFRIVETEKNITDTIDLNDGRAF